jgi:hypothetical protein
MYFNKRIPNVYGFMKHKNEHSYNVIFGWLRENINCNPKILITDFEIAPVNVFLKCFVESDAAGCRFHFGQIMWRFVQKIGCVNLYKEGGDFYKFIRYLLLLAYCPEYKVSFDLKKLKRDLLAVMCLLKQ